MTGARPFEDQGALFGDLDGLFATIDTMPLTPIGEVRLIPTQGGEFTQPAPEPEVSDFDAEHNRPEQLAGRRAMFDSFGWT